MRKSTTVDRALMTIRSVLTVEATIRSPRLLVRLAGVFSQLYVLNRSLWTFRLFSQLHLRRQLRKALPFFGKSYNSFRIYKFIAFFRRFSASSKSCKRVQIYFTDCNKWSNSLRPKKMIFLDPKWTFNCTVL